VQTPYSDFGFLDLLEGRSGLGAMPKRILIWSSVQLRLKPHCGIFRPKLDAINEAADWADFRTSFQSQHIFR
jgi:hypothetical protein